MIVGSRQEALKCTPVNPVSAVWCPKREDARRKVSPDMSRSKTFSISLRSLKSAIEACISCVNIFSRQNLSSKELLLQHKSSNSSTRDSPVCATFKHTQDQSPSSFAIPSPYCLSALRKCFTIFSCSSLETFFKLFVIF